MGTGMEGVKWAQSLSHPATGLASRRMPAGKEAAPEASSVQPPQPLLLLTRQLSDQPPERDSPSLSSTDPGGSGLASPSASSCLGSPAEVTSRLPAVGPRVPEALHLGNLPVGSRIRLHSPPRLGISANRVVPGRLGILGCPEWNLCPVTG